MLADDSMYPNPDKTHHAHNEQIHQEENLQKKPPRQVQVQEFSLEDSRLTKQETASSKEEQKEVGSNTTEDIQSYLSLTFLAGLVFLWFYSVIKYEFAEDNDEKRFYLLLFLVSTILITIITSCPRAI